MNPNPTNCIYDATTDTFVEASAYKDQFGNLVAPPGYSFVQAEVQSTPAQAFTPFPTGYTPSYPENYGNVGTEMYNKQYSYERDNTRFERPKRPAFNFKQHLIEQTYKAIKHGMKNQNLWVETRSEDEGFYTVRANIKKKDSISIAPLAIQKIVSENGITEVSMHYLKRENKYGLTVYMLCRKSNADVLKVINEFAQFKIHARRVRDLPATLPHPVKASHRNAPSRSSMFILKKKSSEKQVRKPSLAQVVSKAENKRDFSDEDPDLGDDSLDENRSISHSVGPSITKPKQKKSLMPKPKDVISLKFEMEQQTKN